MDSSLWERFARLGPIRAIDRVSSGSPAAFALRLPPDKAMPRTIDAMFALARRGIPMLQAKHAIEAVVADERVVVTLPTVEDPAAVIDDLTRAGVIAALVETADSECAATSVAGEP